MNVVLVMFDYYFFVDVVFIFRHSAWYQNDSGRTTSIDLQPPIRFSYSARSIQSEESVYT